MLSLALPGKVFLCLTPADIRHGGSQVRIL
jgi:hypothetical protein